LLFSLVCEQNVPYRSNNRQAKEQCANAHSTDGVLFVVGPTKASKIVTTSSASNCASIKEHTSHGAQQLAFVSSPEWIKRTDSDAK